MKQFLILLIFVLSRAALGQFDFVLSPPVIEMTVIQNSEYECKMYLQNNNSEKSEISTHISGLSLTETGVPVSVNKANEWSCASWITLESGQFTLDAGSSKVVTAKIKVPRNATGGKFAIILYEPETGPPTQAMNVQISGQIGTILMLNILNQQTKKAEIKTCDIVFEKSVYTFSVMLKNTGNTYFKAKGDVLILDRTHTIYDRVVLDGGTGTILPTETRSFVAQWSNKKYLIPGEYKAIFRMNYAGNYQKLECEKSFTIKVK